MMKEPRLIKKKRNIKFTKKEKKIFAFSVFGLIFIILGSSYAYFKAFDRNNNILSFQNGDLNMKVDTTTKFMNLNTDNLSDENSNIPFILTLTNTGKKEIKKFVVKLSDYYKDKTIKYEISTDKGLTYTKTKTLNKDMIIYTGYNLNKNESEMLYVKIYDNEAGVSNLENKNYDTNVIVDLYSFNDATYLIDEIKNTKNKEKGIEAINQNGQSYDKEKDIIREYRYVGLDVNNYLKFNNELWRIVGVFSEIDDDLEVVEYVKIIKNDNLKDYILPTNYVFRDKNYNIKLLENEQKSEASNLAYWNYYQEKDGYLGNNDWGEAGLAYYLNNYSDESANKVAGYLSLLENNAQKMLNSSLYYLGNVSLSNLDSNTIYLEERNAKNIYEINQSRWRGLVGLLYPSDYLFSFSKNKSWLETLFTKNNNIWLLSPASKDKNSAICLNNSKLNYCNVETPGLIYPTINLNSKVKVASGDGSSLEPYIVIFD